MRAQELLALLATGLAACAAPPAPAPPAIAGPAPAEDALPGLFAEQEVDVPARPVS